MTGVVGEIDSESPPMRSQVISVHQRSPGPILGQHTMETHWEESASHCANKHTRLVIIIKDLSDFRKSVRSVDLNCA